MRKILLIAILYIACFANTKAYFPPDSCLKIIPYYMDTNTRNVFYNMDSLMYDTCNGKSNYGELYGKGFYGVIFSKNIIPRNYLGSHDSEVFYKMNDISINYKELTDSLISMINILGSFSISDLYLDLAADSTITNNRTLFFKFHRIHSIQSVLDSISKLPFVSSVYHTSKFILTSVENQEIKSSFLITPNPAKNEVTIEFKGDNPPKEIQIVDEKGNLVLQTEFKEKINVSNLSRGVYFVKINNQIQKFIKE